MYLSCVVFHNSIVYHIYVNWILFFYLFKSMLCLYIVLSFVALYKMHFGLNTNAYECIFPEH